MKYGFIVPHARRIAKSPQRVKFLHYFVYLLDIHHNMVYFKSNIRRKTP
jgi:hypothetical protein